MTKQPRSISSLVSASVLFGALAGTALYAISDKAGIFPQPANAQEVALGEEEVRRLVRDEIAKNPRLLLDTIESYMREQQAAESRKADEQVISRKAEFSENEARPYLGNPEGSVEIVYFFDVNCGYCKRLEPSLKRLLEENRDVRIAMREMPILAPSSHYGAMIEGLVWKRRPDVYAVLHESLMSHQGSLTDDDIRAKLVEAVGEDDARAILSDLDLDNSELGRDVNNRIQENLALARLSGISGTPFVYVLQGDGLMRGAGADAYEQLSALVEKARSAR
jgi:Protein-disulfide isomerase